MQLCSAIGGPVPLVGALSSNLVVFDDRSACSVAEWHSSTINPGQLDQTGRVEPTVTGYLEALTRRSGGRGPRRGRKAVRGLGRGRRTSLGRSRDSRSTRQTQNVSVAANAENSSPSSKTTARFTGSGRVSFFGIGWIGTPSRSTELANSRPRRSCSLTRAESVRRRLFPLISFSSGWRALTARTPRTCRRRVGSRDICTPSTILPVDSTSCRVTRD